MSVRYGRLEAYVQKGNDVSVQELMEKADVLRRHKSFCGVLVFDEPAADMFGELGEERSRFFKEARSVIFS